MINELLGQLRDLGAVLRVRGDTLVIDAPKDAISKELKTQIVAHKHALISRLSAFGRSADLTDGSRPLERYSRDWRAPMALRPCSCGSRWFWLSSYGAMKCCACNPPTDLSLAEAWVIAREPDGRVPGEILSLLHISALRQ